MDSFSKPSAPPGLRLAVDYFGSVAALARALNVSREAVYQWDEVPPKRCIEIEEITGGALTRYALNPDHFGRVGTANPTAQDNAA